MRTSKKGIELIKRFEGLRLKVYKDAVGLPTIGYGHLIKSGEVFDVISEEQAEQLLKKDLKIFEEHLIKVVKIPLEPHQFDALVSLAFNIGCGAFSKSTLLKYLNQRLLTKAADEILRWNKAGGKVLKGLDTRRKHERTLFLNTP